MEAPIRKFASRLAQSATIHPHPQLSLLFHFFNLNTLSLVFLFRLCFFTYLLLDTLCQQQLAPGSVRGSIEAALQHGPEGTLVQERV